MLIPSRYSILILVIGALAGCDQIKTVTQKLGDLKSAKVTVAPANAVAAVYGAEQITQIQESGFESFVARNNALVVVDFYADWCGPCKMLGPVLEDATRAHPGVVFLGKVNVDLAGDLGAKHGVSSIPDVRIYKNGKEVDRFVGFPGAEAVKQKIAALSQGITPSAPQAKASEPKGELKPFSKDWMPPGMERR